MTSPPPADVLDELAAALGQVRGWSPVVSATQAGVWRIEIGDEAIALKVYGHGGGRREKDVLAQLEDAGLDAPRVRWWRDEPRAALATTWFEGTQVEDSPDVHREAGRYLARLHAVPVRGDPIPYADALAWRRDAWVRRAADLGMGELGHKVAQALDEHAIESVAAASGARVLCHRDFEARNWLVDAEAGGLRVIDFGQARPDAWLWDLVKLAEGAWQGRPDLRAAFEAGYGTGLEPAQENALRLLGALHGLQTLVWGVDHDDPAFEGIGRQLTMRHFGPRETDDDE